MFMAMVFLGDRSLALWLYWLALLLVIVHQPVPLQSRAVAL
jgi:hypothetical protein